MMCKLKLKFQNISFCCTTILQNRAVQLIHLVCTKGENVCIGKKKRDI